MHDSGLGTGARRAPGSMMIGDGRAEDLGQLPVREQDGAEFGVVDTQVLLLQVVQMALAFSVGL